jgi:nitroimidazol reductase NimA-like FMN-containing flavoprotein (pyridoxamine 5'-phosphate oxidase superfamily)
MSPSLPQFRTMDRPEIHALLARNHVGRMAYARGPHIDIEPVHYVYSEGWLYGRTSRGAKLEATGDLWWPVAFEVDEVQDLYRWHSVVIRGGFYTLDRERSGWEREEWEKAVEVLRRLEPETFTPRDPTPHRDVVFRIAVQEASGREALPSAGPVKVA